MTLNDFSPGMHVQFQWYSKVVYGTVEVRQANEPDLFNSFVPVRMQLSGCNVLTAISPKRLTIVDSIPQAVEAKPHQDSIFDNPILVSYKNAHWDHEAGHILTEHAEAYYQLFRHLVEQSHRIPAPVVALDSEPSTTAASITAPSPAPSSVPSGESLQEVPSNLSAHLVPSPPPLRNSKNAVQLSFDF